MALALWLGSGSPTRDVGKVAREVCEGRFDVVEVDLGRGGGRLRGRERLEGEVRTRTAAGRKRGRPAVSPSTKLVVGGRETFSSCVKKEEGRM